MKRLLLAAALALLAIPTAASAAVVPVTSLSGDFAATNPSVTKTGDGVHFGPYADGGATGGSLYYSGANGARLDQITALSYSVAHDSSDDSPIAAPYLRIFLEDDSHDVIFDPTKCATVVPPENALNRFDVVSGEVRYDDDACSGTGPGQQAWADVVTAHGSEVISGIYVTTGFAGGADLSAIETDLTVNGDTFCFNCAASPTTGAGTPAPGVPANTTIIRAPVAVPATARPVGTTAAARRTCKGDDVRKIHATRRRGERLLSVRATLRGRRLKVRGRTITVDLRERTEGNYNVRITSRFRTKRGTVRTVRTTRALSVACS
jgi:opacity protein-like surface antigen